MPIKHKFLQTTINEISGFFLKRNRRPNLNGIDERKECAEKNFTELLFSKIIKKVCRNATQRAMFTGMFNRTIRDPLAEMIFPKKEQDFWLMNYQVYLENLSLMSLPQKKRHHFKPRYFFFGNKKYKTTEDNRMKQKRKFETGGLVRTSKLHETFQKEILQIGVKNFIQLRKLYKMEFRENFLKMMAKPTSSWMIR